MTKSTAVEHPAHYTMGKIETIDFIEDQKFPYHIANAVKYLTRYRYKENPVEDLKKALWYIKRYIKLYEKENENVETTR